MNDDLFFIPLIADALRQEDVPSALREAFRRIQELGHEPRWETGYQQFLTFMASVQGSQLLLDTEDLDRPALLELLVEREGTLLATVPVRRHPDRRVVDGIAPGLYRIGLDTGRVLWEERLLPRDVLWALAFPGRPLPMAADTGSPIRQPTREVVLLGGALRVRVFAGIEEGSLELELGSLEDGNTCQAESPL